MTLKSCAACGKPFQPRPQVIGQSYCSSPECQNERRRKWQKEKLKSDADYRENQTRAQGEWRKRNPDYWRAYRERNMAYVERNRSLQLSRNSRLKVKGIAKMDAPISPSILPPGIYRLTRINSSEIAKSDEWIVEISVLASPLLATSKIAKR